MAATTHKLSVIRDASNPGSEVDYEIYAKGLENARTIALTSDVTGSASGDLSSNLSISTTIANDAVTESKLATDAVTVNKIKDGEITKAKLNASAYDESAGSIADGTNANLATKTQVKQYVESVVSAEGHYRGVQSVATINGWTAANLHNGDRVITSSDPEGSGTGTLTLGNLPVVDGQEVIFFVSDDQSTKIWQSSEGNYKIKQSAVSDPTASGSAVEFIDSISQNTNGEITPTKKAVRGATTSQTGVVQLAGSIGTTVATENNKAATEKAVRDAIDGLSATATSTNGTNVQVRVTESAGKVTAVSITTDNTLGKVTTATPGNFASFTSTGAVEDSEVSASDLATAAQGSKADTAIQGVKLDGASAALTPDTNKVVTIPNAVATGETGETSGLMTAADKAKVESVTEGATKVESSTTNGNIKIDGNETTVYTHPTTTAVAAAAVKVGNDAAGHVVLGAALTAADVGLGNVRNTEITVTSTSVSDGTTTFNQYVHPTSAGYKHIPAGGTTGDFLAYDSAGTAKWASNPAAGKADKVQNATSGNFAALDANGNLTDSTKKASDFATSTHAHGHITNAGAITDTGVAIANGDALAIVDASDSSKVAKTSITFDGSTTNKALTPKGTWEEFNGASASSTTPAMDGTADVGSETSYARGDHVHPTDTSREPVFTMNYDSSDNALVFSKAFGTVSSGN